MTGQIEGFLDPENEELRDSWMHKNCGRLNHAFGNRPTTCMLNTDMIKSSRRLIRAHSVLCFTKCLLVAAPTAGLYGQSLVLSLSW